MNNSYLLNDVQLFSKKYDRSKTWLKNVAIWVDCASFLAFLGKTRINY